MLSLRTTKGKVIWLIGGIVVLYLVTFLVYFEPFTHMSLVSPNGEFLGPPLRIDPQVEDIGKIYIYQGEHYGLYKFFKPLCLLWSVFNALTWWIFV